MASACHECGATIIFVTVGRAAIACSVPATPDGPLAATRRPHGYAGWWVTAAKPAGGTPRYTPHAKTCKRKPRRTVADHRRQEDSAPALFDTTGRTNT